MPILKAKHVVSFSSEDPANPADNIVKFETYYKWRCLSGSETNATIILQLDKASQINAIDIGNNGSAFIEVLVGRSSWSTPEKEFEVLLAASSFMTPNDSKAGREISRVRMFSLEHLNRSVTSEKWDQVKIVCTQPYNQSEPYGLSFVKLYKPIEIDESCEKPPGIVNFGRFKLKNDADEDTPVLSSGSFFEKRMNRPAEHVVLPKMSMAALARGSEQLPQTSIFKCKIEESTSAKVISISDDRRQEVANALLQGSETMDSKKENVFPEGSLWSAPKVRTSQQTIQSAPKVRTSEQTIQTSEIAIKRKIKANPTSHVSLPPSKKLKDAPKCVKVKKKLPFYKIMEGVVFMLSGYQNPERGNIRDLALSMGAKYEPSWSNRCTHLICAFANTPKFMEVQGKCKIVNRNWVDDCQTRKQMLNTKTYRLDGGGDSSFESSGSEDENRNTEVATKEEKLHTKKCSSECDTEDEIEKIRLLDQNEVEGDYGGTTDDGETVDVLNTEQTINDLPILPSPDFFKEKHFFLYGDFDAKDSRLIKRYITTYSGSIADYMSDLVHFVISEEPWGHNFQQAFDDNNSLVFIHSKWIFKCHEKQKFLPYETYEIKAS